MHLRCGTPPSRGLSGSGAPGDGRTRRGKPLDSIACSFTSYKVAGIHAADAPGMLAVRPLLERKGLRKGAQRVTHTDCHIDPADSRLYAAVARTAHMEVLHSWC